MPTAPTSPKPSMDREEFERIHAAVTAEPCTREPDHALNRQQRRALAAMRRKRAA